MILIVSPVALAVDPDPAAALAPEPVAALLAQPARARAATQAREPAARERDFMRVLLSGGMTDEQGLSRGAGVERGWSGCGVRVGHPSEDGEVCLTVLRRTPPQEAPFESGDEELGQERDHGRQHHAGEHAALVEVALGGLDQVAPVSYTH